MAPQALPPAEFTPQASTMLALSPGKHLYSYRGPPNTTRLLQVDQAFGNKSFPWQEAMCPSTTTSPLPAPSPFLQGCSTIPLNYPLQNSSHAAPC